MIIQEQHNNFPTNKGQKQTSTLKHIISVTKYFFVETSLLFEKYLNIPKCVPAKIDDFFC